jgi:Zn-finger nucleic acid-binding protein
VDGSHSCSFCGCDTTLKERLLSEVCPICYARMSKGARYCMECGVGIEAQLLIDLPEQGSCPRCEGDLRHRVLGKTSLIECSLCAGMWLEQGCFDNLCQRADQQSLALRALAKTPPPVQRIEENQVRYLPCIRCQDLMVRRNFGGASGVIIDVCRSHGVWLDHNELEKILEFVRGGGLQHMRDRELRQLQDHERRVQLQRHTGGSEPAMGSLLDSKSSSLDVDLVDALVWVGSRLWSLVRR